MAGACWAILHWVVDIREDGTTGNSHSHRELEIFLSDGYLPLTGRMPMLLRGPELPVSLPLLQWGSAWPPALLTPPPERGGRDPLWSRYSESGRLGSITASFLATSLGFSFLLRASALVAWEGCMALRAGEDPVGSRLAEMGQDLLLGGWVSSALSKVGEEEESTL